MRRLTAKPAMTPCLNKRCFRCAYHVNDKRLRPQAFHKPSRVKQAGKQSVVDTFRTIRSAVYCRAYYKKHDNVGSEVKYRTCGTKPDHKTADGGGVPFARHLKIILIHVVPWNGNAGNVVNQVEEKYLNRLHWQERKKRTCSNH